MNLGSHESSSWTGSQEKAGEQGQQDHAIGPQTDLGIAGPQVLPHSMLAPSKPSHMLPVGAAPIALHPRPLFMYLEGGGVLSGVVLSLCWGHQLLLF